MKTQNRRKVGNRALADWDEILATVTSYDSKMREILIRDRFSTDRKRAPLLGDAKGSQAPGHSDPTGDEAVENLGYLPDDTHRDVVRLSLLLQIAKSLLDKMTALSDTDVRKRADRTIPECLVDGELVYGRVRAGFCERHYKQWARKGRPDRVHFISDCQAEIAAAAAVKDEKVE